MTSKEVQSGQGSKIVTLRTECASCGCGARRSSEFAAGFCSRALAQACVSNGRGKRKNRALGRLVSRGYLTPEQAAPYFRKDNDDEFETFLNSLSPGFEYVAHGIAQAADGLEVRRWVL